MADHLVARLREAAANQALPIGEAWALLEEAAGALDDYDADELIHLRRVSTLYTAVCVALPLEAGPDDDAHDLVKRIVKQRNDARALVKAVVAEMTDRLAATRYHMLPANLLREDIERWRDRLAEVARG